MLYGFLITFCALLLADKLRASLRLSFYSAALIYIGVMFLVALLTVVVPRLIVGQEVVGVVLGLVSWGALIGWVMQYAVAAVVLWLLDKYEDTLVAWLVVFIVGFVVLEFL